MTLREGPQGPGGYQPGGGAAGEFGVDLHAMVTAAEYVDHVGSVMTREVYRLLNSLQDSIGTDTNWKGPAADAFRTAQNQWAGAHQGLQRALHEIASGLRDTSTRYDQAEQDSQHGITQAVQGLTYD